MAPREEPDDLEAPDGGAEAEDHDEDGDEGGIGLVLTRAAGGPRRRPHLDAVAAGTRTVGSRRSLLVPAHAEGRDPERRFAAAMAAGISGLAPAEDREVLEQLATAPVVGAGRIPYSSNAVLLLELDAPAPDGGGRLHAIYKPARGERPLWDFPHQTLHFREVATYELDAALGFGLVPPTVLRDGPVGPGSAQLFVTATGRTLDAAERAGLQPQILAMGALDALANNADRKSAHLLVDRRGRLRGIDHGLTFLPYPRQRTVLLELGGAELPETVATAVGALADDPDRNAALVARLALLLAPAEVAATAARLRELADDPVFPELDPWDGRPFEWW